MITNNTFYSELQDGEGFDYEVYLPSLDTDVILWVKLASHGSYDPSNGTINYDPEFKILACVDLDDEPVDITKREGDKFISDLVKDYWTN